MIGANVVTMMFYEITARLRLVPFDDDTASRRVLEKNGFSLTGTTSTDKPCISAK